MSNKGRKKGYNPSKTYFQDDLDEREKFNPYAFTKPKWWDKRDKYQKEYETALRKSPVTISDSEAGTGKTTIAVYIAFNMLSKGEVNKIVYCRYTDDRYLKNGFLPGDLEDGKIAGLFHGFFDALKEIGVSEKQYKVLKGMGLIELCDDSQMRGRNLEGVFLIIDEAQNAKEPEDLQLVLTRLHDDKGHGVLIGHSKQMDNKKGVVRTPRLKLIPFQAYAIHMLKKEFTKQVNLVENYRGEISKHADRISETWNEL